MTAEGVAGPGLYTQASCPDLFRLFYGPKIPGRMNFCSLSKKLGPKRFHFVDGTGSIVVEIDDFGGVKVGPQDPVRLTGEADYRDGELLLEVNKLEPLK